MYNVTVSEATAIATPILSVASHDRDTGVNAGVTYQLLNGSSSPHFYLGSGLGSLVLRQRLDREAQAAHTLFIQATDTGTPPLSSVAQVIVTVTDMNDNPPVFVSAVQRCAVAADAPRGHFVTHVSATDEDVGDAGKLTYALVAGNDNQAFVMDADTGVVEVWNGARLRDQPEHLLNVSVTDGVFTAYAALVVHLLPVNNDSPTFKVSAHGIAVKLSCLMPMSILTIPFLI